MVTRYPVLTPSGIRTVELPLYRRSATPDRVTFGRVTLVGVQEFKLAEVTIYAEDRVDLRVRPFVFDDPTETEGFNRGLGVYASDGETFRKALGQVQEIVRRMM